ncbi:MAG: hypothetical protein M1456_05250 [Actinobacteria bacterium]|nr:hypothetical protein [Actinomycetota bacterium]
MATTTPSNGKRRGMLAGAWERNLKESTWRYGPEAAAHDIANRRWQFRGNTLGMATMILFVIMYYIPFIPHWVSLTVFYTLMAAGFCSVVPMAIELHRYHCAASKAIGSPPFKIGTAKRIRTKGGIPAPPRYRDHYLAWCAKYGQKPYPFKPPDAPLPFNLPSSPQGRTKRNTQQQGDSSCSAMSRRHLTLLVLLGIVFALSIVTFSLRLSTPNTNPHMVDIVIADQILGLVGTLLIIVIVIVWVMDRNRTRERKALQSVEAFRTFVASEDDRSSPIGIGKDFGISEDAGEVGSETKKRILADAQTPLDPPPTPEEVHEAEMNPWPGHTMIETILRNRGQMQSPPSTPPQQPPPQDTNLPPQ